MKMQNFLDYCLSKPFSKLDYPFGPDIAVIKVGSRMFAIIQVRENNLNISLKCEPILAEFLRYQYKSVIPGYHLNKKHWNTVIIDGSVPIEEINKLIDHSYELVFSKLTKESL
ncbi:hypothetical protein ABG79_01355 [Caloramator mitchellensis]|uniref:MmcQ-like protein n=1 Tax=Caloramator mitchellensis TaxID=908809 RepID=A0A0R3JTK5_CALMK|nr:MmcQ/YjbR family DNA-binding protein [Caloramator mitchellensis]KRQ86864.1 hypothetical protein ABG79_01355 [Caloramator mitchellensis]